ncbi:MAG: type I-C CRISPR-associated protein Cas8c/Csd1 [bacterium]
MILQALAQYYQRLKDNSQVALEGFQKQEIPFLIILDRKGNFIGLQDTRQGEGKRKTGRICTVPKAVKKTSGIASNLLWENPAYVLGRPKVDKKKDFPKLLERAKEQHACFISNIHETFPDPAADEGISSVVRFLERGDFAQVFAHPLWPEIEESGANITFQLEGDMDLICQRDVVIKAITSGDANEEREQQPCLITGELDQPVRLHTAIKGVWGAQPTGANIVSFNLPAFNSFSKTQGENAPIGKKAEFAYTTALNTLLAKGSRQRIQVGDASTVFWTARENSIERWFADLFGEPAKEVSDQDNAAIRNLYAGPTGGAPPLDEDLTPFFVLGLAPNAARLAIRFWYAGTVGEVARNIRQHFDDIAILHSPKEPDHLSLFRLLVSTAMQGDSKNIQPNLAGEVMKSILAGTPYPKTLLNAAIMRIKAEQSRKDKNGNSLPNVSYPRAALIKAVLVREARFYRKSEKEVGMSLDQNNANPGYRLGRLFAVLERAQECASPGINATIRDRFYAAASSTPVVVFPHLLKLKNHHIAKLDNKGQAVNLEKQISEIMAGLSDFPSRLDLCDQGRFAIGYYHQRQDTSLSGKRSGNPKE